VTILGFTLLIALGAFAAGFLGSLTGLGGGVVIVPLLLLCGVPLHLAQGASLVSVIATSSGAAASYVKEGFSNIRIGMFLEIATTLGALAGAFLVAILMPQIIEIVFGIVLIFSAYQSVRQRREAGTPAPPDRLAAWLRLNSTYPTIEGRKPYQVYRVKLGFALMFLAGVLSGLLGIGSGALKVLAMDQAMRIPFKVSTTTSNFMIGVTAAASAGIYLRQGYIDPGLSMPVMLGVLAGSLIGARVLVTAQTQVLRRIFAAVVIALALQMIYYGVHGFFGER
jgi:uncharacterized membrane protein YfcA